MQPQAGSRSTTIETTPDAVEHPATTRPTRRTFLVWYMGGLLTATVVAALAPILVYVWPAPAKGAGPKQVPVNLKNALNAIEEGKPQRIDAPAGTAFVMANGGGDNAPGDLAFTAYLIKVAGQVKLFAVNCSHLGCSVAPNEGAKRFECPCHGSMFSFAGDVIHGPAAFPLSTIKYKAGSSDTELLVDGLTLGQGG